MHRLLHARTLPAGLWVPGACTVLHMPAVRYRPVLGTAWHGAIQPASLPVLPRSGAHSSGALGSSLSSAKPCSGWPACRSPGKPRLGPQQTPCVEPHPPRKRQPASAARSIGAPQGLNPCQGLQGSALTPWQRRRRPGRPPAPPASRAAPAARRAAGAPCAWTRRQ